MALKIRRGTAAEWATANPVLAAGEPGLDLTNKIAKLGDGITPWSSLDILLTGESGISAEIQAALDEKVPSSLIGSASGVAPLDADGKIPSIHIQPTINSSDDVSEGSINLYFTEDRVKETLASESYDDPAWITSISPDKVLPPQVNNNNKVLFTDGVNLSWTNQIDCGGAGGSDPIVIFDAGTFSTTTFDTTFDGGDPSSSFTEVIDGGAF